MPDSRLHLRDPVLPWALTAVVVSLGLHCFVWIAARMLVQSDLDAALEETRTQIGLALGWLIASLAFWSLFPPRHRGTAFFQTLLCVAALAVFGSLIAYVRVHLAENLELNLANVLVFGFYSALMLTAQILLAVPAALALQVLALGRGNTEHPLKDLQDPA